MPFASSCGCVNRTSHPCGSSENGVAVFAQVALLLQKHICTALCPIDRQTCGLLSLPTPCGSHCRRLILNKLETKNIAQQRYREFVQQGKGQPSPWQCLKNQIYLGDDDFVLTMQCKLDPEQSLKDVPKKQKQAPIKPLDYFVNLENTRNENMALAYLSGHYTLEQVGSHFGVFTRRLVGL